MLLGSLTNSALPPVHPDDEMVFFFESHTSSRFLARLTQMKTKWLLQSQNPNYRIILTKRSIKLKAENTYSQLQARSMWVFFFIMNSSKIVGPQSFSFCVVFFIQITRVAIEHSNLPRFDKSQACDQHSLHTMPWLPIHLSKLGMW